MRDAEIEAEIEDFLEGFNQPTRRAACGSMGNGSPSGQASTAGVDVAPVVLMLAEEQTMRDLIKSALAGLAMGLSAMVAWYIGSFIGNPLKELQVLRGKVIEQLIRLDHSNNTEEDLQDIVKQLHNIAAQTQAAFLSISIGFKGQYVKRLGFEPTKGAQSLLSLSALLNKSGTQKQLDDVKKEIIKAFK